MNKNSQFTFDANRKLDVICMGRVAVDLYAEQLHVSLSEVQTFRKYLGGCAGNIAVGCARLGLKSAMFSCVGKDEMGLFVKNVLKEEKVDTELLFETDSYLTGLVLLGIDPPHRFPLMFYRKECADMQLKLAYVKSDYIRQTKTVVITGTGLSTPEMWQTTNYLVQTAKRVETRVIFDLDYRPVLWKLVSVGDGETRYKASRHVSMVYQSLLPQCDLIVGTEEEICIAGGEQDSSRAISVIQTFTTAPIVMKKGEKGCQVFFASDVAPLFSKSFPVKILNVLGAGDAFIAGLLKGLLCGETWEVATRYANASGAIVVTRHGCAPAMPYFNEVQEFISQSQNGSQQELVLC